MTGAAEILAELSRRGVLVQVDGEHLRLKPKAALDEKLLDQVRDHKPEILRALSLRPPLCGSPDCAGCYEAKPGKRIHPPQASVEWEQWLRRWEPKGKPQ